MYCTSNTMFNPHSAKERIKNHLAYKLGLVLIEYGKQRKGIPNNPLFLNEDLLSNPQSFQTNTIHKTTTTNSPIVSNSQESISVRGGGGIIRFFICVLSFCFFKHRV